jgi:AraC family transcriptional regulator
VTELTQKKMKTLTQGNYVGENRSQYKMPGLIFTRCFFPRAFNSEWHSHQNSHLTFCLKGGSVEKRKKEDILCYSGILLLYPAHQLHRNTDYVSNSESFSIEFETEWCKSFEIDNLENNTQNIIRDPLIKFEIIRLMKEVKVPDGQSALCIEATLLGILSSLRNDKDENQRPSWVKQLYELLHDEYNNNWSLTSLSEILKVHPVTISKYFPKYFRANIGDYIRKIRTEKALADLGKKSVAIEEIAVKYGFVDNAHFTRVFKKHTGITPSHYRQFIRG